VILGGEDVARAPPNLGTQGSEGLDQDSCLDGHVQGSCDPGALQRLGCTELGPARHQPRHLGLSQVDLQATEVGLGNVLHLVLQRGNEVQNWMDAG
jgi:hypothetical protein